MPASERYPALKIAVEALVLVEKGSSERAAVDRVAAGTPELRDYRRDALDLVLGVLTEQDTIDRTVQFALKDEKLGRRELALSRLVCHVLQQERGQRNSGFLGALRAISPSQFRTRLEELLGVVSTFDPRGSLDDGSEGYRLAFRTHHPRWWVEYCSRLFGRSETVKLLSSPPRPRYVRVNSLRNRGRTSLPSKLKHLREKLRNIESVPGVYALDDSSEMSALAPFYSEGLFQVQDLASFLAVKAADPHPNEHVLDVCAAPGGKTGALAQLMRNRGRIVSVDYSVPRMRGWRNEMARLGVTLASPVVQDSTRLGLSGSFDLVFVDPPCSGTGILDRNPRMKWRLSPELLGRYSNLQTRILEESARLAGSGGRILYCTCSLTVEENEKVVSNFLVRNPDFETRPVLSPLGSPGLLEMRDCRRFYPYRDRTAGYFIARLERFN